ncbi:MAG: hypothetical protein N4A49_03860 [Marinifilaceae bacterium]|jgi:hypothetical protein|nr:hypothetical protein [Marinifilaceae bacterium]
MKNYYLNLFCALFIALFCFSGCSDDDDDEAIKKDTTEQNQEEGVTIKINENSSFNEKIFLKCAEILFLSREGFDHNYQLKNHRENNRLKYSLVTTKAHGDFSMPYEKIIYTYDDNNVIISSTSEDMEDGLKYDESDDSFKVVFEYDKEGYIIKTEKIYNEKPVGEVTISYNENKLLVKMEGTYNYGGSDKGKFSEEYSYTEVAGSYLVSKLVYNETDSDGNEDNSEYIYEFNSKGLVINCNSVWGKENSSYTYKYDSQNRLIEDTFSSGISESKNTYNYTENELQIRELSKTGEIESINSFDKDGFKIKNVGWASNSASQKYILVTEYTKSIKNKVLFCTGTIESYNTDIYYTYKKDNDIVTKVYFDNNDQKLLTIVEDESSDTTYSLPDGTKIDKDTAKGDFPKLVTYDQI